MAVAASSEDAELLVSRFSRPELEALVMAALPGPALRAALLAARAAPPAVSARSPFARLNGELTVEILRLLPLGERVAAVCGVCRAWRALRHDPRLWSDVHVHWRPHPRTGSPGADALPPARVRVCPRNLARTKLRPQVVVVVARWRWRRPSSPPS